MALKLGHRVTVKPGVSPRMDEESRRDYSLPGHPLTGKGQSRDHFVGHKGEVVQIGNEVLKIKVAVGEGGHLIWANEAPAIVPPGYEGMVLVDDGVQNGIRQGPITMREWFREDELEAG